MNSPTDFDRYAACYDDVLNSALAATGEKKEYFAERRIAMVERFFRTRKLQAQKILDFGCGSGSATPYLLKLHSSSEVVGLDVSAASITVAQERFGSACARFSVLEPATGEYSARFDLVFTNGVFHHISPGERHHWLRWIRTSLRPGGVLAFWENNPRNPATLYVMDRCEFDRDAITISPSEARSLLLEAGFQVIRTEFSFFFPRALRALRFSEAFLKWMPLGGQYVCFATVPSAILE